MNMTFLRKGHSRRCLQEGNDTQKCCRRPFWGVKTWFSPEEIHQEEQRRLHNDTQRGKRRSQMSPLLDQRLGFRLWSFCPPKSRSFAENSSSPVAHLRRTATTPTPRHRAVIKKEVGHQRAPNPSTQLGWRGRGWERRMDPLSPTLAH